MLRRFFGVVRAETDPCCTRDDNDLSLELVQVREGLIDRDWDGRRRKG